MIFDNLNNLEALNQFKEQLPEGEKTAETDSDADSKKTGSSQLPFSATGNLRIWLERQKGNRVATLVKGFEGTAPELDNLAKALKTHCGVGGTAKNGDIILQGDHREKVLVFLREQGFQVKKAGG